MKIAVLPGDGIGTEIVAEAVKVLDALKLPLSMETECTIRSSSWRVSARNSIVSGAAIFSIRPFSWPDPRVGGRLT